MSNDAWTRKINEAKRTLKAMADKQGITVRQLTQEAWDYGLMKIRFGDMPDEYDPTKDPCHPSRGWQADQSSLDA